MTGPDTSMASRPERNRLHGNIASNRRGASRSRASRASTIRKQRLIGAAYMLLIIAGMAAIYWALNTPAADCSPDTTSPLDGSLRACQNRDNTLMGIDIFLGIFGVAAIWYGFIGFLPRKNRRV